MNPCDHELSEAITGAAHFLIEMPVEQRNKPTIPLLRELFGLRAKDSIAAIREADRLRVLAYAGGAS